MHQTHNTLREMVREQSVLVLNRHLAAAIDLLAQVKLAHWNVRGHGFIAIHELFDSIASLVGDDADALAERCGALGGSAAGEPAMATS